MSEEFHIEPRIGAALKLFLYSQLFRTPSYPTHSFANQTIIVTGSNVGLGLEAARHFYRLNCAKLVLAVRSLPKGQAAKESILRSVTHRTDAESIEVWSLNLSSTESTISFAERVSQKLARVDVVVQNAGINSKNWAASEGIEMTMQVNVLNTFLLSLLLLPKMKETKTSFPASQPHLSLVTSEAHHLTPFKQVNASNVYEALSDEKSYNGQKSYEISKLIQILLVRELISRINANSPTSSSVILNLVNPGLCFSALAERDEMTPVAKFLQHIIYTAIARTTEIGSRTLVIGAHAGLASHGEFMSDGEVQGIEPWIYEDVGRRAQKKIFEQTMQILEKRQPGLRDANQI